MDEKIIWRGPGLALRRQRVLDEIESLEIVLHKLDDSHFVKMAETVLEIEALRAELDAIDDVMAVSQRDPVGRAREPED